MNIAILGSTGSIGNSTLEVIRQNKKDFSIYLLTAKSNHKLLIEQCKEFNPEFILLSAGFDAHKDDPLAQINLESKDYYTLTKRILDLAKNLCNGKVVSILEGGYDLNALKESVDCHVKSLMEYQ